MADSEMLVSESSAVMGYPAALAQAAGETVTGSAASTSAPTVDSSDIPPQSFANSVVYEAKTDVALPIISQDVVGGYASLANGSAIGGASHADNGDASLGDGAGAGGLQLLEDSPGNFHFSLVLILYSHNFCHICSGGSLVSFGVVSY